MDVLSLSQGLEPKGKRITVAKQSVAGAGKDLQSFRGVSITLPIAAEIIRHFG
jgi:hypothetical protein